jgi:hypothetical protein
MLSQEGCTNRAYRKDISGLGCGETQSPIPTFADAGQLKSERCTASCIQIGSLRFSQPVQGTFRHFAAFRVIEATREFLFVGMATTT